MSGLLSVNSIFFTALGYPMSYVEFFGTVFCLWSVWLVAKRNVLTWPVGMVSVVLYLALFYQIRLYSDALEQAYYLAASVYGWWFWTRSRQDDGRVTSVRYSSGRSATLVLAATGAFSAVLGFVMGRVHLWAPSIFPEPASFAYVDALTTGMSFTGQWLMARRRIESWMYWIAVDVIGIWLYHVKDVRFISLLYVVLLALATKGLIGWQQALLAERADPADRAPHLAVLE